MAQIFKNPSTLVGIRPFSGKDSSLGHIQRDLCPSGSQENLRQEDTLLSYAAQAPLRSKEFHGAADPGLAEASLENGYGCVSFRI